MKALVIAGVSGGVGKTTIATGLMGALTRRGLRVQPFKAGPDYIDPTYHTWASGVPSRNLDTWMLPPESVVELFQRATTGTDVAVIEGVMGLYDGHSAIGDEGSTAALAKLLGAPVFLVVDARSAARSVAAVVKGFVDFDPLLRIAGVILNGIGSAGHLAFCREAIEHYTPVKVLGYMPHRTSLSLPERHLGLVPTVEGAAGGEFLRDLIAQCEETFDIPAILDLSAYMPAAPGPPSLFPDVRRPVTARIAVARDKVFSFYYQDNLDLLEAWGAEIAPFSPLGDAALPGGASGVYIGGGFPEMYSAELAANHSLMQSLRVAVGQGVPVYAECGGLMYLGTSMRDLDGNDHRMAGILPLASHIDQPRLSLGYRTVEALADGPLLKKGEQVRGHEFHWSVLKSTDPSAAAYRVLEKGDRTEGFQYGSVLASYVHIHFGSLPSIAPRFVEVCRRSNH